MEKPTEEGMRRHPPDGIYKGGFFADADKIFWEACTCSSDCPYPCKGQCDCKACNANYNDFLSME